MDVQGERLAIEFISALGLPPVEYVELAQSLGCGRIGIAPEPISHLDRYPSWSLRHDRALVAALRAAVRRCDVTLVLGEGFLAWPDKGVESLAVDMDLMCELGVPQINLVCVSSQRSEAFDQCAAFARMASARGLGSMTEFMPGMAISDLDSALAAVRHVGNPDFRIMVDAMHFFRSGSDLRRLATLDRSKVAHAQLCDVPWVSQQGSYGEEARFERLPPGEGELPLREFLQALPAGITVGLEVPMLSKAKAGIGPVERLRPCLEAAAALLRSL
jgi:sugar phosphate isomerase/epimerase